MDYHGGVVLLQIVGGGQTEFILNAQRKTYYLYSSNGISIPKILDLFNECFSSFKAVHLTLMNCIFKYVTTYYFMHFLLNIKLHSLNKWKYLHASLEKVSLVAFQLKTRKLNG